MALISVLGPGDVDAEKRWDTYVGGHPTASGYQTTGWRRVIARVYGYPGHYLYAEQDGQVVGVLPLAHIRTLVTGNVLVSLPFTTYGGISADSPAVAGELLEAATGLARRLGARRLELRHVEQAPVELPSKTHRVTMWLDLPPSEDALWKAFRTELRTDIRRRLKDGLEVRVGGREEVESFYRVFVANMRDLGTPPYAKAFFSTILAEWPGSSWVATCYHRGAPVASGFLLGFRGTLEIPWASSLASAKRLRPNMLLYWECLRHAIGQGFTRFDFGRSAPGGGTFDFKRQWGARAVPLYWQYWLARPGDAVPSRDPGDPRFALAIRAWQRLPLAVTRVLGPRLVRYFP